MWTSYERVVDKSWNKWLIYEHFIKKCERFVKSCEQVLNMFWGSHEEVVDKFWTGHKQVNEQE